MKKVKFTQMKKGTKEDYLLLDNLEKSVEILANEDIKRSNIFSRVFKSLNYLVWGDV